MSNCVIVKNKTTTYILLTGVLLIWGLVFYRVFAGLSSEDEISYQLPQKKIVQDIEQNKEEAFVLFANYRDPFLGNTSKAISGAGSVTVVPGNNTSQVKSKKKEPEKKEPTDWSFLDYIGIVNNKETNKQVGLLVISGKEYMVNDKDVINEVTIVKKVKDSLLVEYRGEKKWLRR